MFTLVLHISCQQFGEYVKVVGCLWVPWAQGRGCMSVSVSLVLYISCQQLGGCMLVVVYISIVYIMPTIWGISISCSVSLGPSGPGLGGCMSIGVYIDTVNIMPTIGGMYISWSLNWYCLYCAKNWGSYVVFNISITYIMPTI